jgi:hypothetical protein
MLLAPALAVALMAAVFAQDTKKDTDAAAAPAETAPFVWGFMGRHSGCVIFKEYARTTRKFFGIGPKSKTFSGLLVIATEGYSMPEKKWVEDDDGLKELQRLALRDGLTYVKIEENYSPELLAKAHQLCEQPSASSPSR